MLRLQNIFLHAQIDHVRPRGAQLPMQGKRVHAPLGCLRAQCRGMYAQDARFSLYARSK